MAKIENTVVYPYVTPQPDDYVVLTDVSDNNATKTCKIKDITSFSGISILNKTISAGALKASGTNPIILVPNLGANKICFPLGYDVVFKTVAGSVPFNFGVTGLEGARICTNPLSSANPIYSISQQSLNGTTGTYIFGTDNFDVKDLLPYRNSPILFHSKTPPTVGNGSFTINFQYRIITI